MLKKLASTILMFGIGASTVIASTGCYVRSTDRGGYRHHHGHAYRSAPPPRRSTTIVVRP